MSNLRVEHRHGLSTEEARERVRALGEYFQNKHGIHVQWSGEESLTLQGKYAMFSFTAKGTLIPGAIAIEAPDPGMLLRSKAREYLENKLKRYLDAATPLGALPRR
ncbi:MAG: polyhydroxyalkanoic acid system family protein [Polyangiaceae bacterium]|jgi:hypothetical protein|nr:polyhydroxyalkanoic acid system family protein [Polyangiaceae bacterium]